MQDLPKSFIDEDIERSLRLTTPAPLMDRQKQARARLMCAAAAQPMLPPKRQSLSQRMRAQLQRWYRLLVTDASVYERARRPPQFYQYYNAHNRFSFYIIRLSA